MKQALWVLFALVLAGCAESGSGDGTQDCEGEVDCGGFTPPPDVTDTTGNIRGIVLTPTILPIEGVTVTVLGAGISAVTGPEGTFQFGPLDEGTYFLEATKPGFATGQSSVQVVGGVSTPPVTKIQLQPMPGTEPRAETYEDTGVIYCSWGIPISYGYCGDELGSPDDPSLDYPVYGIPSYIQIEVVWDSTQPASENLYMINAVCPPHEEDICPGNTPFPPAPYRWDEGTWQSPAIMRSPEGFMERAMEYHGLENMTDWFVGVDVSADGPALATGVTIDQKFSGFVTIFWNIEPDEEWTYIRDGPYVVPQ